MSSRNLGPRVSHRADASLLHSSQRRTGPRGQPPGVMPFSARALRPVHTPILVDVKRSYPCPLVDGCYNQVADESGLESLLEICINLAPGFGKNRSGGAQSNLLPPRHYPT